MRQVRRKTIDLSAKTYLLKAKTEGINLSWNQYETMLPQDGFSQLGLSCFDCMQGPCRINPFRTEETHTVCGLNKEDLVFKSYARWANQKTSWLLSIQEILKEIEFKSFKGDLDEAKYVEVAQKWRVPGTGPVNSLEILRIKIAQIEFSSISPQGLTSEEKLQTLLKIGREIRELALLAQDLLELIEDKSAKEVQVGLGTLKSRAVNLCFEGASPGVYSLAKRFAAQYHEEAVKRGASEGFNLLLVGDLVPGFNTVSNLATVEFALLTGLVDLYWIGESEGRGINVAQHYHTITSGRVTDQDELRKLFIKAAEAFEKRDVQKIVPSENLETVYINPRKTRPLLEMFAKENLQGLCIIAGGSNLKVTQDDNTQQLARTLAQRNVLCLAYGNTAVTLGKYGYLNEEQNVRTVGSELSVGSLFQLAREWNTTPLVVVFPELNSSRDLQLALAFAELNLKVYSGIQIAGDQSTELGQALSERIEYCDPKVIVERVSGYFSNPPSPAFEDQAQVVG